MYTAYYEVCWKAERDLQECYARHNGLLLLNEETIDSRCSIN